MTEQGERMNYGVGEEAAVAETQPSSTGGDTPTSLVSTVPTLGQILPVGSAICSEMHTWGLNLINTSLMQNALHFHYNKNGCAIKVGIHRYVDFVQISSPSCNSKPVECQSVQFFIQAQVWNDLKVRI